MAALFVVGSAEGAMDGWMNESMEERDLEGEVVGSQYIHEILPANMIQMHFQHCSNLTHTHDLGWSRRASLP